MTYRSTMLVKKNLLFYGISLLLLLVLGGCQHITERPDDLSCLSSLVPDSRQAVAVSRVPGGDGVKVKVSLLEKTRTGWRKAFTDFDAVAGRKGLAPVGEKREGDGKTPSGIFSLRRGFGYSPLDARMDYIVLTKEMIWVDDPTSPYYNTLVSKDVKGPLSFETMRRDDDLYKYGMVIEYNTDPVVPGLGSAIFFHIWRGPNSHTAGCVAMSEENMLKLLRWVDAAKRPVAVLGMDGICPGCLR